MSRHPGPQLPVCLRPDDETKKGETNGAASAASSGSESSSTSTPAWRALAEVAPHPVYVMALDGRLCDVNTAVTSVSGYSRSELLGMRLADLIAPADRERFFASATNDPDGVASPQPVRVMVQKKDGRQVPVGISQSLIDVVGDRSFVGAFWDMSMLHDALPCPFEHSPDATWTTDRDGRVYAVSAESEVLTGYAARELLDAAFFDLLETGVRERIRGRIDCRQAGIAQEPLDGELVRKDGTKVWVEIGWRAIAEEPDPFYIVFSVREATRRHEREEALRYQALHDPLTGLANRALWHDRLTQALARSTRDASFVVLMVLDLDNFKQVNDEFGHRAGDNLLVMLAGELTRMLRAGETVARLGGDEFAIIVEGLVRPDEVAALVSRLQAALEQPFPVGHERRPLQGAFGLAVSVATSTPETLFDAADRALYANKALRTGRGSARW